MSNEAEPQIDFPANAPSSSNAVRPDATARRENDELFSDEERTNKTWYRWMRLLAFLVLGTICATYFWSLLSALSEIAQARSFAAIFGASADWHHLLFVTGIFAVFAAVPLSIAAALVKMVSELKEEEKKPASLTTAQAEGFKAFMAFIEAFKK